MSREQMDLFNRRRRAESPAADPDDPVILPDRLIVHPLTLEKYANINCVHTIDRTGQVDAKDLKVPPDAVLVGEVERMTFRTPACCVSSAIDGAAGLVRVGVVLLQEWTEVIPPQPDHESCPLALNTRVQRWGQHVKVTGGRDRKDYRCLQQVTLYPGDRCYPWELDVEQSRWAYQWVQEKAELYGPDSASHFRGIAFPSYFRAYGEVEGPTRERAYPPSTEEVEMLLAG